MPVSTQLTISKAAQFNQRNEVLNVFLVANSSNQTIGTGFLIKSGNVITNEHVVHGAHLQQLMLLSPNGQKYSLTNVITDTVRDLAILTLSSPPTGGLELGDESTILIGDQVYSWGYPFGYNGTSPLLSVGYISGVNAYVPYPNKRVKHLVVNGALNPGNSGGALIHGGVVIGVVQSKLSPMTPAVASALHALETNNSGMMYSQTDGSGKVTQISEAQVIGQILDFYREVAQVMIADAVSISELKAFLYENRVVGY